ncbi:MAG: pentapeptide repeat-containing protein [Hyphomicrobiales bacterium]|nr:MAG: pentapeptide repeat-containing protein [Hyphomicrobiales bacterium]
MPGGAERAARGVFHQRRRGRLCRQGAGDRIPRHAGRQLDLCPSGGVLGADRRRGDGAGHPGGDRRAGGGPRAAGGDDAVAQPQVALRALGAELRGPAADRRAAAGGQDFRARDLHRGQPGGRRTDAARGDLFPQEGADLDQPRDAAGQQELLPVGDAARSGAEAVRAGHPAGPLKRKSRQSHMKSHRRCNDRPSPLEGEGARKRTTAKGRLRGADEGYLSAYRIAPRFARSALHFVLRYPSSGATRHLLPQGEKAARCALPHRIAVSGRGIQLMRMALLALLVLLPGAALAGPADELRSGARTECRGCDLSNESFKKLDLAGVDLSGANLTNASFHRANLKGANLAGVMAEGANFNLADLSRADLSRGQFKDAMFYEAQLSGAKFGKADLTATRMQHARLTGADMSGADLDWAVMKEVRLNNADLTGASLERTNFEKASLGRTRFDNTTITSAGFLQATAPGASFADAKISLTDFYGAALDNADFAGAVLSDNRFTRARLKLEQFADATYTRNILPDGRVQGAE